jgi:hypothetical protein
VATVAKREDGFLRGCAIESAAGGRPFRGRHQGMVTCVEHRLGSARDESVALQVFVCRMRKDQHRNDTQNINTQPHPPPTQRRAARRQPVPLATLLPLPTLCIASASEHISDLGGCKKREREKAKPHNPPNGERKDSVGEMEAVKEGGGGVNWK